MSPRMNAWSLLYEELKMSENFEDRYEDGIKSKHYYEYDRNDINRANPFSSVSEASSELETTFLLVCLEVILQIRLVLEQHKQHNQHRQ